MNMLRFPILLLFFLCVALTTELPFGAASRYSKPARKPSFLFMIKSFFKSLFNPDALEYEPAKGKQVGKRFPR
jgi:hypothetical protein